MAKPEALRIHRGYARGPSDEERLRAKGVKSIYRTDKGETIDKFKMRAGELLGVVDGLRAFGTAKAAMVEAECRVHGAGAAIIDVETGLRSDRNGVKMMSQALDNRTSEEYRDMQSKATLARHKGRMSEHKAKAIWFGKLGMKEAVEAMGVGWSQATAYRRFGKRNVPKGIR